MDYSNLSKRFGHFSIQRRSLSTLRWQWWTLFNKHFHVQSRSRPALFPPEIWSMYQSRISDIGKTNNHAEAAHRRLKRELDAVHSSIWKFIDGLRRVQKGRNVTYEQYVPAKRREYILADQRFVTIVNDYNNRDIIEYLRGIAHNFLME